MLKRSRITHVRQGVFVLVNKKNEQQNAIKSAGAAIHFLASALNLPQASVEEFRDTGYNQPNSPPAQGSYLHIQKDPIDLHMLLLLFLEPLVAWD